MGKPKQKITDSVPTKTVTANRECQEFQECKGTPATCAVGNPQATPGASDRQVSDLELRTADEFASAYAIESHVPTELPPPDPSHYATRISLLTRHCSEAIAQTPAGLLVEPMNVDSAPSTTGIKRKQDVSPDQFRFPKKTFSLTAKLTSKTPTPTATTNRFEPLSSDDDDDQPTQAQVQAAASASRKPKRTQPTNPPVTKSKVPPIVLTGTTPDHKQLVQDIKSAIRGDFHVKYAYNSILIYTSSLADYNVIKSGLLKKGDPFYTYTTSEDKSHAFVLRGLTPNADLTDLKQELIDTHNLGIKNIYKMKTVRTPLFLVVTEAETTLKHLQVNVRYLQNIKISWERRRNERRLSQCRRCQMWGHAASNCNREPRCMKCADPHFTFNCPKPPTAPPKCVNCQGEHTAANLECPTYKRRIALLEKSQPPPPTTFRPAPQPTTNPWTQRSRAQAVPTTSTQPSTSVSVSAAVSAPSAGVLSASAAQAGYSDFQELFTEIRELKTLINFSQAILAIRELKRMLVGATTPMDKLYILDKFESDVLPKFNI